MKEPFTPIGWVCTTAGGFLLGASAGATDHTIAAALFYAVAVLAFTVRSLLPPAHQTPIENKGGGQS